MCEWVCVRVCLCGACARARVKRKSAAVDGRQEASRSHETNLTQSSERICTEREWETGQGLFGGRECADESCPADPIGFAVIQLNSGICSTGTKGGFHPDIAVMRFSLHGACPTSVLSAHRAALLMDRVLFLLSSRENVL